ncbi:hypothetical protein [Blastococcus saxobsidens]|nr:hypothetical protein [Blastococcus saxobsidens]
MTGAARRIVDHLEGAESSENAAGGGEAAPHAGSTGPTAGARVLATT